MDYREHEEPHKVIEADAAHTERLVEESDGASSQNEPSAVVSKTSTEGVAPPPVKPSTSTYTKRLSTSKKRPKEPASKTWFGLVLILLIPIGILATSRYIGGRDGILMEMAMWIVAGLSFWLTKRLSHKQKEKAQGLILAYLLVFFFLTFIAWLVLRTAISNQIDGSILKEINDYLSFFGIILMIYFGLREAARQEKEALKLQDRDME